MTDGKHRKRVKINVNGEHREDVDDAHGATSIDAGGTPGGTGATDAPDLSVADAVDVAFDDIMADARASRASRRKGKATGAAAPGAPARDAGAVGAASAGGESLAGGADAGEPEAGDQLAEARAQSDEYLRHLQRLQAEFDNYRKRVQRDNEALIKRASEGVVESLLPVIDNMQRAMTAAQEHEADALVEGVELVAGQFRSVLESHGLEDVPAAPGLPFDPTVHEAVLAQPHDDFPEGTITQVLERGYLLHGRLLRPTKVIVAA